MRYEPRFYRDTMGKGRFRSFTVTVAESDLWIGVDPASYRGSMEERVLREVRRCRDDILAWGARDERFLHSLEPVTVAPEAPPVVRCMATAGAAAGVGPMAAVAGAIAERVGRMLCAEFGCREVVVENGGDLWGVAEEPLSVLVYAGASPLSEKVALEFLPEHLPLGICTSAGTVGHSLSFGKADAALIASRDAALADAYATALGNRLKAPADVDREIERAARTTGICAALFIVGERLGVWGVGSLVLCEKKNGNGRIL